ncbi:MAG: pseudouridine synthase [Candidatus Fluviicola riflensis]|nr:MAG: pseudouridine synthase [Candidatus Fluviicola riflensis]
MLVMNTRKPSGGAKKLAAKGRTTGSAPSKSRTSGSSAPKKFADRKPFDKKFTDQKVTDRKVKPEEEGDVRKPHFPPKVRKGDPLPSFNEDEIRLNKYLSNAGVCSRREADVLIQSGVVSINGTVVTEMGYKVKKGDSVQYDGETINAETKRYVLLNKPKDFITTMDDPWGRKTVMGLVMKACKERIYPVGRLDRDTTGLLLFTNDGDLAKKLTHPRYEAKKIYHVEANRPVSKEHLEELMKGIELDDGLIKCDQAEYVKDGASAREVGIEIHSGKNRIVRRMFEKLGYEVVKLDRVQFASLTKKDLPRGFYRHLTDKEVAFLKMTK